MPSKKASLTSNLTLFDKKMTKDIPIDYFIFFIFTIFKHIPTIRKIIKDDAFSIFHKFRNSFIMEDPQNIIRI